MIKHDGVTKNKTIDIYIRSKTLTDQAQPNRYVSIKFAYIFVWVHAIHYFKIYIYITRFTPRNKNNNNNHEYVKCFAMMIKKFILCQSAQRARVFLIHITGTYTG